LCCYWAKISVKKEEGKLINTNALLQIDELTDQGFQIRASAIVMPESLQLYANGSKEPLTFGEYGNPWGAGVGVNWWPFEKRGFRVDTELIYMNDSPVGASSLPYTVGGNCLTFVSNLEVVS